MEDNYTKAKQNLGSTYGTNVSLVITPELELALKLLTDHEGLELINALLHTIRGEGEKVDTECMYIDAVEAYKYFTGPDYNIKDLILPRISK